MQAHLKDGSAWVNSFLVLQTYLPGRPVTLCAGPQGLWLQEMHHKSPKKASELVSLVRGSWPHAGFDSYHWNTLPGVGNGILCGSCMLQDLCNLLKCGRPEDAVTLHWRTSPANQLEFIFSRPNPMIDLTSSSTWPAVTFIKLVHSAGSKYRTSIQQTNAILYLHDVNHFENLFPSYPELEIPPASDSYSARFGISTHAWLDACRHLSWMDESITISVTPQSVTLHAKGNVCEGKMVFSSLTKDSKTAADSSATETDETIVDIDCRSPIQQVLASSYLLAFYGATDPLSFLVISLDETAPLRIDYVARPCSLSIPPSVYRLSFYIAPKWQDPSPSLSTAAAAAAAAGPMVPFSSMNKKISAQPPAANATVSATSASKTVANSGTVTSPMLTPASTTTAANTSTVASSSSHADSMHVSMI
jgi:hypothetical protein